MANDPTIKFKADTRQLKTAKKDLDNVKKSAFGAGKAANDAAPKIGKMSRAFDALKNSSMGAKVGVAAVGLATAGMLKTFANAERGQMRLGALFKSTGGAAGISAERINHLSEEIGRNTLQSAEGMRDAAGALMTFRAITGEQFERTLHLTADLAEILGTDARSAALQFGKALEDPKTGLTMLRRSGVSFTESQKEMIFKLQESGDLIKAQTVVLGILEGQFGGTGAGAGGGLAGAADLVGENLAKFSENLMEATGIAALATGALTGVGKALGFIADKLVMTDTEKLESIMSKKGGFDTSGLGEGEKLSEQEQIQQFLDATKEDVKGAGGGGTNKAQRESLKELREIMQTRLNLLQENAAAIKAEEDARDADLEAKRQKEIDDIIKQGEIKATLRKAEQERRNGEEQLSLETRQEAEEMQAQMEYDRLVEKYGVIEALETQHKERMKAIENKFTKEKEKVDKDVAKNDLTREKRLSAAKINLLKTFAGNSKTVQRLLIVADTAKALTDNARTTITNMALARQSQLMLATPDAPARAAVAAAKEKMIGTINAAAIVASAAGQLGGTSGGGGGSVSASAAAEATPVQPTDVEAAQQEPEKVINVTINDSIDPAGARRIVEALNEATEDGLQINALVA